MAYCSATNRERTERFYYFVKDSTSSVYLTLLELYLTALIDWLNRSPQGKENPFSYHCRVTDNHQDVFRSEPFIVDIDLSVSLIEYAVNQLEQMNLSRVLIPTETKIITNKGITIHFLFIYLDLMLKSTKHSSFTYNGELLKNKLFTYDAEKREFPEVVTLTSNDFDIKNQSIHLNHRMKPRRRNFYDEEFELLFGLLNLDFYYLRNCPPLYNFDGLDEVNGYSFINTDPTGTIFEEYYHFDIRSKSSNARSYFKGEGIRRLEDIAHVLKQKHQSHNNPDLANESGEALSILRGLIYMLETTGGNLKDLSAYRTLITIKTQLSNIGKAKQKEVKKLNDLIPYFISLLNQRLREESVDYELLLYPYERKRE